MADSLDCVGSRLFSDGLASVIPVKYLTSENSAPMSIDSATGTTALSSRGSAKRPPRAATVLHLVRSLDHSGEARMAIEFAAALNDIGGRAAIAYDTAEAVHELQRHGIQPIEVKLGGRAPFSGFGAAKRLAKLVAESNVEILHAHFRRGGACDQQKIETMRMENLDIAVGDQFRQALRSTKSAERCAPAELDLDRLDAVALQLMGRGGGMISDGRAPADIVQCGSELDGHAGFAAVIESTQQMEDRRGARRPVCRAAAAVSSGSGDCVD